MQAEREREQERGERGRQALALKVSGRQADKQIDVPTLTLWLPGGGGGVAAASATSDLRYCISVKLMDRQTEHGNKLLASAKMIDKCQWLRMC